MNKIITYMVNKEDGIVYSRVGNDVAIPVLDYKGMTPENGFKTSYSLEKCNIFDIHGVAVLRTKKIPIKLKNRHRSFWGMKSLRK